MLGQPSLPMSGWVSRAWQRAGSSVDCWTRGGSLGGLCWWSCLCHCKTAAAEADTFMQRTKQGRAGYARQVVG